MPEIKFFQERFAVKVKLISRKKIATMVDPIIDKYGNEQLFKVRPIKPAEDSGITGGGHQGFDS